MGQFSFLDLHDVKLTYQSIGRRIGVRIRLSVCFGAGN